MTKDSIILIGGGGHCKSVIDVIEATNKYEIIGIVDLPEKKGSKVLEYEIQYCDDDLPSLVKNKCQNFVITLGQIKSPHLRIKIYNHLVNLGANLPNIISPTSYISSSAKLGSGNIIMHQTLINREVTIGNNCIINNKALIEHDARVDDHCHIATSAVINGSAHIGEKSFIGSNATIVNNVVVPQESFVKAGSLVKLTTSLQ